VTTDERVMTLFERANPVPDNDDIDSPLTASRYLDTLHQRSSTMTLTTTEPEAPEHTETRRWPLLAAAAARVLAPTIGGLVLAARDDKDETPLQEQPPPDSLALPVGELGFPGSSTDAGTYESDVLGVPLTFTVADDWTLWNVRPNNFTLTSTDQLSVFAANDYRLVRFMRVGGWHTRDEATDISIQAPGSIDPYDIDAWIADNDVVVDVSTDTVVSGRATRVLDIGVDPASDLAVPACGETGEPPQQVEPCFWYAALSDIPSDAIGTRIGAERGLSPLHVSRFWLITIDGHDPLLVHALAPVGDDAWLDEFEAATIHTLILDDDAPPASAG
jgi:hypothetical protein